MASFSLSVRLAGENNGLPFDSGSIVTQGVQAGQISDNHGQNIGTAAEQVVIAADVGTIGALVIRSLGYDSLAAATTKTVVLSYESDASAPFATVTDKVPFVGKPTSATIYAKAETGATNGVNIQITAMPV